MMSRRRILVAGALVAALGWPVVGWAQSTISAEGMFTTRVVIGGTTFGTTSPLQVMGLPTLAGSLVTVDGSGNIGIGGAATAPSSLAVTGALSANGNVTLGGTLSVTGASTLAALSATTGSFSSTLGVTGAATFAANTGATSFASRTTGWRISTAGDADVRSLFVDNLSARTFTADIEQVIVGSQRVTKSSSTISQAFTCPALGGTSTLWVDDIPSAPNLRVFASGDSVSIRNFSRSDGDSDGNLDLSISDCVGVVTSYADGTSGNEGQQSWTFTRNTGANGGGMTASTVVAVKTLALDYGTTGMGFAEVSAVDGSEGQNAPYYQLATWTTAPIAANTSVRCRLGNLSGSYGYSAGSSIFGLACGDSAATNVTVDPTNGFRIRSGTTNKFAADTSGNLSLTGDLAMGTAGVIRSGATALDTATGYWLAHNAGTPQFRIGTMSGSTLTKGIRWDGTNLKVLADTVAIDQDGIRVTTSTAYSDTRGYMFEFGGAVTSGGLRGRATTSSARSLALDMTSADAAVTSLITTISNSHLTAEASLSLNAASTAAASLAAFRVGAFSASYADYQMARDTYVLARNGTTIFHFDLVNGRLGINDATPSYALDVTGEINATSTGYFRGGALVTGTFTLGATAQAGTMSFASTTWTQFIGDGTGYTWALAKRSSSTTTNVLTVNDSTNLVTALGTVAAAAFTANGSAGIDMNANPTTCSNLQFVKGILVARTGC